MTPEAVRVPTPVPAPSSLAVRDPRTHEVIADLPVDDAASVERAVARAREAQVAWGALAPGERVARMKAARRELVRDRIAIHDDLERETGKPRVDVAGETLGVALEMKHLERHAARWLKPQRVTPAPFVHKRGRVVYKPRGVIGIISPWNAPLHLSLSDAIPALVAGNAVVIKPSELTPLAVRRAVWAMNRALPEGLLQVVIGAADTGAALVDRVDMICVTGSPATGRKVMERASRRLTPVLLELGGKDPMIVLEDADLDRAAAAAAWGGFMMAGQVCMSVERIYVARPVAAELERKIVAEVETLRHGPDDVERDYGPFIHPRQVEVVERHLADARAKGARVVTGGERASGGDAVYYRPTVLADVDHGMDVMREETFGPVVALMPVDDDDEAVRLANDCDYGLNASVWTRDVARGLALAERLESGSACVNEMIVSGGVPGLPFGGVKQSGVGHRHGDADGLRQFCHRQALLIEARGFRREPTWFPYSERRARLLERILGLVYGR